jgi:hypothetical protein
LKCVTMASFDMLRRSVPQGTLRDEVGFGLRVRLLEFVPVPACCCQEKATAAAMSFTTWSKQRAYYRVQLRLSC